MKISKYTKIHKDVMMEYVYDDNNLLTTPYHILLNIKDNKQSYISSETSNTLNVVSKQLFNVDMMTDKWSTVNVDKYPFLIMKDYAPSVPIKHDRIKIHLANNYNFGEFIGFHIRVFAMNLDNSKEHDLCNYYYDRGDVISKNDITLNNPPLNFQEKLWNKSIDVDFPSIQQISSQYLEGSPIPNTINYNLTNGIGLSYNSPIFIEFSFIKTKNIFEDYISYSLDNKITSTLPASPEYENLNLIIEHSNNGDFFEIYGTYKDSISEFKKFMDNSKYVDKKYYIEYTITLYEKNIRGKSIKILVDRNFNEKVEYRPILKYTTTTAYINVEMRIIDEVDGSHIIRKGSYGMKQDEVSKYSLNLLKINLANANKAKIYNLNLNSSMTNLNDLYGGDSTTINNNLINGNINGNTNNISDIIANNNIRVEVVKVPFPVLVDKNSVVAKTESVRVGKDYFYGIGQMKLLIYPFDNIIKFILANKIEENKVDYMDLTSHEDIKIVFKDDKNKFEFPLYTESDEIDLKNGSVVFKISENRVNDVKKIFNSKNVFYITSKKLNITTPLYSSVFKIYDSDDNIIELNDNNERIEAEIILDEANVQQETATVTVRTIENRK